MTPEFQHELMAMLRVASFILWGMFGFWAGVKYGRIRR